MLGARPPVLAAGGAEPGAPRRPQAPPREVHTELRGAPEGPRVGLRWGARAPTGSSADPRSPAAASTREDSTWEPRAPTGLPQPASC